jgi:hypothetical protein
MSKNFGKITTAILITLFLTPILNTASAQTQYYLTLETFPEDILAIDPEAVTGEGYYSSGSTATFSAKPIITDWDNLVRWEFVEWTTIYDEPISSDNPAEWFMDGDYTFVAKYEVQSYYLEVITDPAEVQAIDPTSVSGAGWHESGEYAIVDAKQTVTSGPYTYEFSEWLGTDPYEDEEGEEVNLPGNQAARFMDGPATVVAVYTVLFDVDWEASYEDSSSGTSLKISDDDKFFQFSTPEKDFPVKEADFLSVRGGFLIMWHSDPDITLAATAILNPRIDFCLCYAVDKETGETYWLRDRIGAE